MAPIHFWHIFKQNGPDVAKSLAQTESRYLDPLGVFVTLEKKAVFLKKKRPVKFPNSPDFGSISRLTRGPKVVSAQKTCGRPSFFLYKKAGVFFMAPSVEPHQPFEKGHFLKFLHFLPAPFFGFWRTFFTTFSNFFQFFFKFYKFYKFLTKFGQIQT